MKSVMIGSAAVLLLAGSAGAADRDGFNWGVGGGFGQVKVSDCSGECSNSGFAGNGHVGYAIGERAGLVFDSDVVAYKEDTVFTRRNVYYTTATGGVQFWATERFWVRGGAGFGWFSTDVEESTTGFTLAAAAGYDVKQGESLVIDLQGRYNTTKFNESDTISGPSIRFNSFSVQVGLNWY